MNLIDCIKQVHDYYRVECGKFTMQLWMEAFKNHDPQDVISALSRHIKNPDNGQFLPKIADIIKMLNGTSKDAASVAWAKVMDAAKHYSPYDSICFDDPIIHCALSDMGGWPKLCTMTNESEPFLANDFKVAYIGYKTRADWRNYPSHMVGIAEPDLIKHGHDVPKPRLVGDKTSAKNVYLMGVTNAEKYTHNALGNDFVHGNQNKHLTLNLGVAQ